MAGQAKRKAGGPIRPLAVSTILILAALAVSAAHPYDRLTWVMEVFPLTNLLYVLIVLHALVLMIGGSYSYARVPFGFELESWLHLGRNPYDKIGHFFQGFVPALVLSLGQGADEFLGTQGDPWDTQSDMFCALLGGLTALVVLAPLHDRQINERSSRLRTSRTLDMAA